MRLVVAPPTAQNVTSRRCASGEVTWHPQLQQLVYSPVEEQEQLRRAVIGSLQSRVIAANATTALELPAQLGNQSEVRVSFERPAAAVRLSVNVMVDAARSAKGVEFFIDYQPGAAKVTVGSGGTTDMLSLLAGDKTIDLALFELPCGLVQVVQRTDQALMPGVCTVQGDLHTVRILVVAVQGCGKGLVPRGCHGVAHLRLEKARRLATRVAHASFVRARWRGP